MTLDRTRGRWRQDDQQDILKPKERLQPRPRRPNSKYKMKETLTLKIGNPNNGALPLLLLHKEGRSLQKVRLTYPLSFNGGISLDVREGEIDGP